MKQQGPDIDALLRPLREAYAERLPGHLQTMREFLARIEAGEACRAELCTLAHRLRGTAGTYGLPLVGEALAKIDELLTARGDDALSEGDLGALHRALEAAAASLPP